MELQEAKFFVNGTYWVDHYRWYTSSLSMFHHTIMSRGLVLGTGKQIRWSFVRKATILNLRYERHDLFMIQWEFIGDVDWTVVGPGDANLVNAKENKQSKKNDSRPGFRFNFNDKAVKPKS